MNIFTHDSIYIYKYVIISDSPSPIFDKVFFTLILDGGGLNLSTVFSFVKTVEKVNFLDFFAW